MMPTFPRSPLSSVRLAFQAVPSWMISGLSLLPACAARHPVCIRPSCASWSQRLSALCRVADSIAHRRGCDYSSAPGALAQVRVIVSRTVITYSAPSAPLAGTSQFHRMAAYTRCLRCAGAPKRPASGSGLSLLIPSWHAVLSDPGEFDIDIQKLRCRHWPSPNDHRLGTPITPAIRSTRAVDFVASLVRLRYGLPGCSPPCTDQTGASSLRGLLLPGFQRIGLPLRCWI